MAKASRIYFENTLDVDLWLKIIATRTDLEFHIYDYRILDAVRIPAKRTASHDVTAPMERFLTETAGDDGGVKLGMDYWIMPHLRTMRAISTNDTRLAAGKVNQPDGPVISFYPVKEG